MLLVQNEGAANTGTSGTIAFSSDVTEGDLLLVVFLTFDGPPDPPTDSLSNTWVNIVPFINGTGGACLVAWCAIANSSGACTVSYSSFPSANEGAVFLEEWSGVSGAAYAGTISGAGSSLVCPNVNMPITSQDGIVVLFAWQSSDTVSISVTPGTSRQSFSVSSGGYVGLADAPFSQQSDLAGFTSTWSSSDSEAKDITSGMIFLFGPESSGSAANSSYAS
jgi:hypothetical protein